MYLVFVTHKGDRDYNWRRLKLVCRLLCMPIDNVVYVDTSMDLEMPDCSVVDKHKLNTFFEFSGYQHGLQKASQLSRSEVLDSLVLNDTAFLSHSILHVFCYLWFVAKKQIMSPAIIGISSTFLDKKYISSFLFRVVININEMASPTVLYSNVVLDEMKSAFEDDDYYNAVNNWLNPAHFYSGWYKAVPGKKNDQQALSRKKMTIYFEHSMLDYYVKNYNACFYDLHESIFVLKATAFYDRLTNIVRKIMYRLKHYIRNYFIY